MTASRVLILFALLAAPLGASGQTPDSVRLGADTTQVAPDSLRRAQAAADSVRRADEAALDALVTRIDAVRESRAASQPWYVRWAWPLGLAVLALAALGIAAALTFWLAGQRLVSSDEGIARATGAARAAETAAHDAAAATREATAATSALRRDVEKQLRRAEAAAAEAGRELERIRALIDRDDRADRFRDVFGVHVRGPKSTGRR